MPLPESVLKSERNRCFGKRHYRGIDLHTGILRKLVKTTICTAYTLFSKCLFLLFLQRHLKFVRGVLNSVVSDVAACALDERLQRMLCYGSLEVKTNAIDIY